MQLQGGVEFTGNPDELVLVTPQTVYDSIPEAQFKWRAYFDRIIGHSVAGEYVKKGDIYIYALNAYADLFLPKYTILWSTFYYAAHSFLIEGDLKPDSKFDDENLKAFWEVGATGHFYYETTDEQDPCFDKYRQTRDTSSYFGRRPFTRKAQPYPGPCVQERTHFETLERGVDGIGLGNWQWSGRDQNGAGTIWHAAGGVTVDMTTIEVVDGGQIFLSLPDLPLGAPQPPLLVGRVVDFGPPGPPGPQGPKGATGSPGPTLGGDGLVNAICSLSGAQKDEAKNCLGVDSGDANYLAIVLGATPLEIKEAQQIILETAPDVVVPKTQIILSEAGEATLTAEAAAAGGWLLVLTLPIAGLLLLKGLLAEISVFTCNEVGEPATKQISFPVLGLGENSQLVVWQELFKQLSYLLQCCKPCESFDWQLLRTSEGDDIFVPEVPWKAMRLVLRENPNPEVNAWYRKQDIRKLGLVRWLHAIERHDTTGGGDTAEATLLFWNSKDQIFMKPPGDVTGFEISQEYPKEYDVWVLLQPLTASGIKL